MFVAGAAWSAWNSTPNQARVLSILIIAWIPWFSLLFSRYHLLLPQFYSLPCLISAGFAGLVTSKCLGRGLLLLTTVCIRTALFIANTLSKFRQCIFKFLFCFHCFSKSIFMNTRVGVKLSALFRLWLSARQKWTKRWACLPQVTVLCLIFKTEYQSFSSVMLQLILNLFSGLADAAQEARL